VIALVVGGEREQGAGVGVEAIAIGEEVVEGSYLKLNR
jgi:hypothetical protein